MVVTQQQIGVSIKQAVASSGNVITRTRLYKLIAANKIRSYKIGRRRLIDAADLRRFITESPSGYESTK